MDKARVMKSLKESQRITNVAIIQGYIKYMGRCCIVAWKKAKVLS